MPHPNKGVSRKNNPDYEAHTIMTRDGVKQTVYKKKQNGEKKHNKGTPEKRRGGFKTPKKKVGLLNAPPTIASQMAKPINNYQMGVAQTAAMLQLETMNSLSGRAREALQGQAKAPTQVAKIKKRSRPAPNPGGGDGRT
jgi:hypothetical protein